MYQTDFQGVIEREGCLVFSIYDMTCDVLAGVFRETPPEIPRIEMRDLLESAHQSGVIQRSRTDRSFGMYVMNHAELANIILEWLGYPDIRCRYIASHYLQGEKRTSWGDPVGNNGIILQVATASTGGGHFRRLSYDPYYPSPGIARVRSIRYYRYSRSVERGAA